MIFFDSDNAPNAPNEALKTTLFFYVKYSNNTIIVQIKILKNLNLLKINMLRFYFEVSSAPHIIKNYYMPNACILLKNINKHKQ